MYARRIGERTLTFDFARGLVNDNLLIADRETGSLWSQLEGKAIQGPMEGTPLEIVPSVQTTWAYWREKHPATEVVLVQGSSGRPYFYFDPARGTGKGKPGRHDTSALGLGLVVSGVSRFFPFGELEEADVPLTVSFGDERVTIHYEADALTAWAEDAEGRLLPAVLAYEKGWMRFFPDSEVFRAASGER